MFVNQLDLEEGWDSYQSNGAIVRQAMVVICKTTGMAITYFTQSTKKDKNLSLLKDFVTWLALRYNLKVTIIRLDNKMNQIKTKDWRNNMDIFFEPCASDIYAQISSAKRFGCLIMEKARVMKLFANLAYKP